jgi:hypothetical protein
MSLGAVCQRGWDGKRDARVPSQQGPGKREQIRSGSFDLGTRGRARWSSGTHEQILCNSRRSASAGAAAQRVEVVVGTSPANFATSPQVVGAAYGELSCTCVHWQGL